MKIVEFLNCIDPDETAHNESPYLNLLALLNLNSYYVIVWTGYFYVLSLPSVQPSKKGLCNQLLPEFSSNQFETVISLLKMCM